MNYDFSHILNCEKILAIDSIHQDLAFIEVDDSVIHHLYINALKIFCGPFTKQDIISLFKELVRYKISLNMPYAILDSHINSLKDFLLSHLSELASYQDVINILALFKEIKNIIAYQYLMQYIDKLTQLNQIRQNSLSTLLEAEFISYYESHLIWLTSLAQHIKNEKIDYFPELSHTICDFGKWLSSDAKSLIKDELKYQTMYSNHINLHRFAQNIFDCIEKKQYRQLITYLEECELISLQIGMELALLDNTIITNKIDTDSLTNALNRNSLENIFKHQYELSLATKNSFILAMCDLDFFKKINDTYGHLAGDAVLKHFVQTVRDNSRNTDIIVRYGGEEFIIIFPALTKSDGYTILTKIRKKFEQTPIYFEGQEIYSTFSTGLVQITPTIFHQKGVLNRFIMSADKRLYKAKRSGRNKIEISDE